MQKLILSIIGITLMFTSLSARSYQLNTKFETKHYGVYEALLEGGETYNESIRTIIAKDVAQKKKFQSTVAVFTQGSKGLNSTIKEPVLGIITTENYDGSDKVNASYNNHANTASAVGIYVTAKQLSKIADNRSLNPLLSELIQMPLLITEMDITLKSRNYQNKVFYTYASRALIVDLEVIDSVYYTKEEYRDKITDKCKVNVLAVADRALDHVPYFIAAHGAVNHIECK